MSARSSWSTSDRRAPVYSRIQRSQYRAGEDSRCLRNSEFVKVPLRSASEYTSDDFSYWLPRVGKPRKRNVGR
jgi:hypothetical protein